MPTFTTAVAVHASLSTSLGTAAAATEFLLGPNSNGRLIDTNPTIRAQAPGGRRLRAQEDLRSSFITFLMSDANSDEALKKAVAHAMRHAPAQQASSAYDKERAERTWAAAVQVAGAFAARFE